MKKGIVGALIIGAIIVVGFGINQHLPEQPAGVIWSSTQNSQKVQKIQPQPTEVPIQKDRAGTPTTPTANRQPSSSPISTTVLTEPVVSTTIGIIPETTLTTSTTTSTALNRKKDRDYCYMTSTGAMITGTAHIEYSFTFLGIGFGGEWVPNPAYSTNYCGGSPGAGQCASNACEIWCQGRHCANI
jgi:hypothetical protein